MDSYSYSFGSFTPNADPAKPGTFSGGSGKDIRTIILHVTSAAPSGMAERTTREVIIEDEFGRELQRETQLYRGSGYDPIGWSVNLYDEDGHVSDTYSSNSTHAEQGWGCCNKEDEVNAQGILIDYSLFDGLGRVLEKTKEAGSNILTSYTYDGAGRRLSQSVSSNGLTLESFNSYDLAGRIISSTDQTGLETAYGYTPAGRITSITRPGSVTEITSRHMDGKIKDITGTGVIPRYYEYGVNTNGTTWSKIYTCSPTSPMWEKTTSDMLGRTVKMERPGPSGIEIIEHFYNGKGHLIKTSMPGQADTLFEYDCGGAIKSSMVFPMASWGVY